jgi:hypothetical protein
MVIAEEDWEFDLYSREGTTCESTLLNARSARMTSYGDHLDPLNY